MERPLDRSVQRERRLPEEDGATFGRETGRAKRAPDRGAHSHPNLPAFDGASTRNVEDDDHLRSGRGAEGETPRRTGRVPNVL